MNSLQHACKFYTYMTFLLLLHPTSEARNPCGSPCEHKTQHLSKLACVSAYHGWFSTEGMPGHWRMQGDFCLHFLCYIVQL